MFFLLFVRFLFLFVRLFIFVFSCACFIHFCGCIVCILLLCCWMLFEDIGEGLCPGSGLCLSRLAWLSASVRGKAELTRPDRTSVRSGGSCSLCLLCRFSALLQIAGLRLSDLCRNVERQKNNYSIPKNHGKHSIFSLYIFGIICYLMSMDILCK